MLVGWYGLSVDNVIVCARVKVCVCVCKRGRQRENGISAVSNFRRLNGFMRNCGSSHPNKNIHIERCSRFADAFCANTLQCESMHVSSMLHTHTYSHHIEMENDVVYASSVHKRLSFFQQICERMIRSFDDDDEIWRAIICTFACVSERKAASNIQSLRCELQRNCCASQGN